MQQFEQQAHIQEPLPSKFITLQLALDELTHALLDLVMRGQVLKIGYRISGVRSNP